MDSIANEIVIHDSVSYEVEDVIKYSDDGRRVVLALRGKRGRLLKGRWLAFVTNDGRVTNFRKWL